ncbi:glycosyltransferase family 2 protein [Pontibacter sp. HSC-36F09]|uniref:glycosyltransferase family 2 protein n=1 Tax=Pontibacter sp. HSC-36F09 TaxID=2910966 RepID=UPI00209F4C70|nr:glycosyltransferase family 2 protein [Pontibacter sp. HSC-36F09]MCP2043679.1 glycosyltransferase involved in cell wall biosynthesis [Pontibacter sp. HSC-36F09]
MIGKPLVSIIIPTYKRSQFITHSIDSVLNQTYSNIEILIIDDNGIGTKSQIATKSVLEKYLSRGNFKYVEHIKNSGVCAARNTGLCHIKGDYVAFLDDDDIWDATKLEKQIAKFAELPLEIGMLYTGVLVLDEVENKSYKLHSRLSGKILDDLLFMNQIGTLSSVLVRREVIKSGIRFDNSLKARNDLDFYIEISKRFQVDFVDEFLVTKHDHVEETISRNMTKKLEAWTLFYEKHRSLYEQNIEADIQYKIGFGHLNMLCGKYRKGLKYFTAAFLQAPLKLRNLKYLISSLLGVNIYNALAKLSRLL